MKLDRIPAGALVFLGGGFGATLRAFLTLLLPGGAFPLVIWACNLAGAYLLGLLTGYLGRFGKENAGRRALYLILGTGACGGFTTYSTFALGSLELIQGGEYGLASTYLVSSLLGGALCCWLGFLTAERLVRA